MKKTNKNKISITSEISKEIKTIKIKHIMRALFLEAVLITLVFSISALAIQISIIKEKIAQNDKMWESYQYNLEKSKKQNNVYRDEEYGFEIKYPNYINYPSIRKNEGASKENIQKSVEFIINKDAKVSIFVWNLEAIKDDKSSYPEFQTLNINGYPARQSKNKKEMGNENEPKTYSLTSYIYSKSQVYQIDYSGSSDIETMQLYKNMVASFTIKGQ